MDTKRKIGIYFTAGSNWLGGVYYLVNLVNSFNYLSREEQQEISFVVFYNDDSEKFTKLFTFQHITLVKVKKVDVRKTFLKSLMVRKNYFLPQEIVDSDIDGLYPFNDFPVAVSTKIKLISWYPDLQHKFYPEYFQIFKLWQREFRLKKLLKLGQHLVMSSQDVKSHFDKFYPGRKLPSTVLPFVSLTDATEFEEKEEVKLVYGISKPYFMVSNQFYKHKNHKTLLYALALAKKVIPDILVAMTGKMEDYRDPSYINELKKIIKEHDLEDNVKLLGVIPRNKQLSLMKYALAVIQPSLFEGWSTVVEDVKSIGGAIIASDIAIHQEQLGTQGVYFEHKNAESLADQLVSISRTPDLALTSFDYRQNILTFARSFKELF